MLNAELLVADKLLETGALVISHVLLDEATCIGDLALLVDVGVLDSLSEHVLVLLDHASNRRDVELVRVGATAEVVWQIHLLADTL